MIFMQADSDEIQTTFMVIVLETDNLQRMEKADPVTLESGVPRGILKPIKYPERVRMLIAYEKDSGAVYQMIKQGRDSELVQYLMRGYHYLPKDGMAAQLVPREGA